MGKRIPNKTLAQLSDMEIIFERPRNIVIDIRPLMGGKTTGIEIYIRNLLKHLFAIDKKNNYILFANASKDQSKFFPKYKQKNVSIIQTKIPNKILNLSLCLFKRPRLDKLILRNIQKNKNIKTIDLFFMPDLRLSALSKKVKKITVSHDLSFHHYPQFFSKKSLLWYKMLNPYNELETSDAIIAVSNFTKNDIIKTYGIDKEKITTIYEGVEKDFTKNTDQKNRNRVRKKYKLPHHYALFLATLEPRKNMKRLIEAFTIYKKKHPESTIALVMAGETNKKIFSSVKLKNQKDIFFTGFIDEKDKAMLIKEAKFFLYPSLFEGFGLPIIEAMKCNTPIITSTTSSMTEITGKAGILVNPYNISQIADAIHMIQDPKIRKKLQSEMAIQVEKFTWEKCARETLTLFEKTIL